MDMNQPTDTPHPLVGKTITIDKSDVFYSEPKQYPFKPWDSEQGIALMLARKLHQTDDYVNDDLINMSTGIGVSPEFHALVDEVVRGKLTLRYFATVCFLAGRLSMAVGQQRWRPSGK
jgi:hypothetical protein